LENRGIEFAKLNQAYFYGTEGMGYYSGGGYGSGLLADSLYLNYGLLVDHYVSINLNSFREIINAMGGLDVYLPHDVYKRVNDQPVLFLEAGSHHLNGKEVEMLARQRISIGDFGRINNQTIILKAVAAQMLTPSGISALPALIEEVQSNVLTDLSPADISQLLCLAGMLDFQQDILFSSLPEDVMIEQMVYDPVRAIDTAAIVGNDERIGDILRNFQTGINP
jgi:LCP family protein required for cell wall assembly